MWKSYFVTCVVLFHIPLFLLGCSSSKLVQCTDKTNGASAMLPCWRLNGIKLPEGAMILDGNKHIDGWNKSKNLLINQAMLIYAKERHGEDVSLSGEYSSLQKLEQAVGGKNKFSQRIVIKHEGSFKSSKDVNIKVELIDYYYRPDIEKLWVLVREAK